MKILFMGTPEFAKVSLESIIEAGYDVCAVVTQPDKPTGRKMKLTAPPVKEYALQSGISVYQPDTLKSDGFYSLLESLAPDIFVVVAYGKILPKAVLSFPKYGCINVHASLLPKYRGAAPINAAIFDGATVTGITTMYMDKGIDTGDMILKSEISIGADETYGELHDRLATTGGKLLVETLKLIESTDGKPPRAKQPVGGEVSYAAKITDETCLIDWNASAISIHNRIRGLSPVPGAYTTIDKKKLKIIRSRIAKLPEDNNVFTCGTVFIDRRSLYVKTLDSCIELLELQLEGSKVCKAIDMINGRRIEQGMVMGT
ncbi:methionyl-tRNA formyltransferase [Clostridia bacterium]|nr:methionyl-tRNA formyltransferase [Clostridia bacterium]